MRTTILDAVRAAPTPVTVAELAAVTGVPATTVRFHLRTLVADGLVVADTAPHSGRGRPRILYRSRAAMDPSGPRNYELLAEVVVEALACLPDASEHALEAGRAWGRQRARVDTDPAADLLSVLDDFGFAPEPAVAEPAGQGAPDRPDDAPDGAIVLHRCPFLELARKRPGVTCAVHRGIMQGVLAAHGTPMELVRLDAFVGGDHCLATFHRPADADGAATTSAAAETPTSPIIDPGAHT